MNQTKPAKYNLIIALIVLVAGVLVYPTATNQTYVASAADKLAQANCLTNAKHCDNVSLNQLIQAGPHYSSTLNVQTAPTGIVMNEALIQSALEMGSIQYTDYVKGTQTNYREEY